MIIITAGQKYNDIDALACAVAYQELLTLQGIPAQAVLTGPLNNSVTPLVRQNTLNFVSDYSPNPEDRFVLVDISNPEFASNFVEVGKTVNVFDHHYGFEDFWKEKIGEHSKIEMIGAAATLIFEEFRNSGLVSSISPESANLLSIAIASNTLNFTIDITSQRDREAFEILSKHTNLAENWIAQYFTEQDRETYRDPERVIRNDTKAERVPGLDKPLAIGQLELWDGAAFLGQHKKNLRSVMTELGGQYWMVTIPSISQKRNYIYSENPIVQEMLNGALGISFTGNIALTSSIILRKQILKAIHTKQ